MSQISQLVKAPSEEVPDRVAGMIQRLKEAEKELEQIRKTQMLSQVESMMGSGNDIGPYRIWTVRAPDGLSGGDLRQLVTRARDLANPERSVGLLVATADDGKISLAAAVNQRGQDAGLSARELLAAALPAVDGRGGGKVDMAQGGGSKPEGLEDAFTAVRDFVAGRVK